MEAQEEKVRQRLERAIEDRVFPGGVVGVVRRDGARTMIPRGNFTYESSSSVVESDTVYDVASITKSIPTSSIALKLIEEGKLNLDDKLTKYLRGFHNNYSDDVLIRHLLTYSVILDFPVPDFSIEKATPAEVRKNLLTTNLRYPPGEKAQYTNSPALLLTMVIENITGSTIDKLAAEYFFEPLGMTSSTFAPQNTATIPPTEITQWRGLVQGVVHDETSYVLEREHPTGCAGLFSNVPDILKFLEMLLNEGSLNGRQYFTPEMVRQLHTNQLSIPGAFMGLGWELNEPRFMGTRVLPSTFGKTGFTGTVCVIDPERGIAFVLLSNRTYPHRGSADAINQLRRDISDIVLGSV